MTVADKVEIKLFIPEYFSFICRFGRRKSILETWPDFVTQNCHTFLFDESKNAW